eukprot:TRINITY_DN12407_c0_g1_i1.p4 TRINITY_DN12407_c0_g1~~TRINITY_DN12407_c0_g1_i1.p4  ORF type:complete len:107 (+),score=21.84 TRINITY_DN12407_c0_g1_i1:236-556(+)
MDDVHVCFLHRRPRPQLTPPPHTLYRPQRMEGVGRGPSVGRGRMVGSGGVANTHVPTSVRQSAVQMAVWQVAGSTPHALDVQSLMPTHRRGAPRHGGQSSGPEHRV